MDVDNVVCGGGVDVVDVVDAAAASLMVTPQTTQGRQLDAVGWWLRRDHWHNATAIYNAPICNVQYTIAILRLK